MTATNQNIPYGEPLNSYFWDVEEVDTKTVPQAQPLKKEPLPKKLKRLTLDLPEELHLAIKLKAATSGCTMADMLRGLLEKEYLETEES